MTKSMEYGLSFAIITVQGSLPRPIVQTKKSSDGTFINGFLAGYFSSGGISYTRFILQRMEEFVSESYTTEETILSLSEDPMGISGPPFVVCFGPAAQVQMPMDDFIQILEEWIEFLDNIPFEHILKNE